MSNGLTLEKLIEAKRILEEADAPDDAFVFHLVQHRFPRSKKRRIREKWSKRLENYRPLWL